METVNYGRNKFYDTGPWSNAHNSVTEMIFLRIMTLAASKAGAKLELLFNKLASEMGLLNV
jgi:hypothetical protein